MRNQCLLLFMFFSSICCFGQESEKPIKVYCQLLGEGKFLSSKVSVKVDFGQERSFWSGNGKQELVDENGKTINFNSMVDGMNYMGRLGWKFEQAYVITVNNQNVYHWLLSKEISKDDNFKLGIVTKKEYENNIKEINTNNNKEEKKEKEEKEEKEDKEDKKKEEEKVKEEKQEEPKSKIKRSVRNMR